MSANNLFLKSGFVKAPLQNGFRRFVLQCQRITLKFCKSHGGSIGVREFIEKDAIDFARRNPGIVLYLKPRRHRSPVVVAEYLNGHREWMSLQHMSVDEVSKWMELLRSSDGDGDMLYKNYHHTDTPSIQGPWNPFTHKPQEQNLFTFPNPLYKDPEFDEPSATDIIRKLYGNRTNSSQN